MSSPTKIPSTRASKVGGGKITRRPSSRKASGSKVPIEKIQHLYFYGDKEASVNSLLQYYTDQDHIDEKFEPLTFLQEKKITANLKEEGKYEILCTSHAGICNTPCKYDRMMLYDLAQGASTFVVCFHLCVRSSFISALNVYIPELQMMYPDKPICIIGLGAELRSSRVVTSREVKTVLDALDRVSYFECDSVLSPSPINQLVPNLNKTMVTFIKESRERESISGSSRNHRGTVKSMSRRKSFRKTMGSLVNNAA